MRAGAGALLLALLALSGCARPAPPPAALPPPPPSRDDLVVLLPGQDGKTGAVSVSQGGAERVLDAPYAAAQIKEPGRIEAAVSSADAVNREFGEALSALLYLGLEFAERQRTGLREDIEDLQREVRDLRQMVDVLGPASLGTQRILSHWAAQSGGLRVSEDELLSEGRAVAEEEWQGQLAERGLFSPGALAGKSEE